VDPEGNDLHRSSQMWEKGIPEGWGGNGNGKGGRGGGGSGSTCALRCSVDIHGAAVLLGLARDVESQSGRDTTKGDVGVRGHQAGHRDSRLGRDLAVGVVWNDGVFGGAGARESRL